MKFMLCLDGSRFSEAAVPICRKLATASGAEVILVRAIEHHETNLGEPYSGNLDVSPAGRARLEREDHQAKAELEKIAGTFTTPADTVLLHSKSAADVLLEEAKSQQVDLIVMSTHSRSVVGEIAFGSTANELVRSGVAPVLMVHPVDDTQLQAGALPVGSFVFTADGEQIGKLTSRIRDRLEVTAADGEVLWFSLASVEHLEAGRLLLNFTSADLRQHTLRR